MSCKKYGVQYVGETANPLHIQMNEHRSDVWIKTRVEKSVADHFSQPNHSLDDLEVRGIEKICEYDTMQWRRQRKSYWIFQLKPLNLNGINVDG